MNAEPIPPAASLASETITSDGGADVFHLCLFSRDGDLAARAVPALEKAVRTFRDLEKLELELWPFEGLDQPGLAERAFCCAERADAVAVVADDADTLGAPLHDWLELWNKRREHVASRLLVFCHAQSPERFPLAPVFCELTDFAVRTGVGLISCGVPAQDLEAGNGSDSPAAAAG